MSMSKMRLQNTLVKWLSHPLCDVCPVVMKGSIICRYCHKISSSRIWHFPLVAPNHLKVLYWQTWLAGTMSSSKLQWRYGITILNDSNYHQLTYPLVCHFQAPPPAYESVAHISNPSYMATVAADSSPSAPTVHQEGEATYMWYKIRKHAFAEARRTSIRWETANKMLSCYDICKVPGLYTSSVIVLSEFP